MNIWCILSTFSGGLVIATLQIVHATLAAIWFTLEDLLHSPDLVNCQHNSTVDCSVSHEAAAYFAVVNGLSIMAAVFQVVGTLMCIKWLFLPNIFWMILTSGSNLAAIAITVTVILKTSRWTIILNSPAFIMKDGLVQLSPMLWVFGPVQQWKRWLYIFLFTLVVEFIIRLYNTFCIVSIFTIVHLWLVHSDKKRSTPTPTMSHRLEEGIPYGEGFHNKYPILEENLSAGSWETSEAPS